MTRVTLLSKWLPQSRSLSPPPKMFWTKWTPGTYFMFSPVCSLNYSSALPKVCQTARRVRTNKGLLGKSNQYERSRGYGHEGDFVSYKVYIYLNIQLKVIEPVTVKGKSPLAGNTVSMDRLEFWVYNWHGQHMLNILSSFCHLEFRFWMSPRCNWDITWTSRKCHLTIFSSRRFLEKYMPRLASHLHYRTVDVKKQTNKSCKKIMAHLHW